MKQAKKTAKANKRKVVDKLPAFLVVNKAEGIATFEEKHPWPKNMEHLCSMLADNRAYGYSQGSADMKRQLETQFKDHKERTEVKIKLLDAAGQAFGELARILSSSGYVLNDAGERR